MGLLHGIGMAGENPSTSVHVKVDPGSLESNVKVTGPGGMLPLGPPVMKVCGGTLSTENSRKSGVGSRFPLASLARTEKV